MRLPRMPNNRRGTGHVVGSRRLRVTMYLADPELHEKIRDRAQALEIGNGPLCASIIAAYFAGEPRPILLGVDEHS